MASDDEMTLDERRMYLKTAASALRFVPPAALAALIVPDLAGYNGALALTLASPLRACLVNRWRGRSAALVTRRGRRLTALNAPSMLATCSVLVCG